MLQETMTEKKPLSNRQIMLYFTMGVLCFAFLEFLAQLLWLTKDLNMSLVRTFAFTGTTLIAISLALSIIFKFFPTTAKYWRYRRYAGVSGFLFIVLHVFGVLQWYVKWDINMLYPSRNPFVNPVVFGSMAFPILLIMALTSSDYILSKIGAKPWKIIHRFVYLAFIATIFHFMLINPLAINTLPGYLLMFITAFAVFGEIFWFFKIAKSKKFKSLGSFIGILLILLAIILLYFALKR